MAPLTEHPVEEDSTQKAKVQKKSGMSNDSFFRKVAAKRQCIRQKQPSKLKHSTTAKKQGIVFDSKLKLSPRFICGKKARMPAILKTEDIVCVSGSQDIPVTDRSSCRPHPKSHKNKALKTLLGFVNSQRGGFLLIGVSPLTGATQGLTADPMLLLLLKKDIRNLLKYCHPPIASDLYSFIVWPVVNSTGKANAKTLKTDDVSTAATDLDSAKKVVLGIHVKPSKEIHNFRWRVWSRKSEAKPQQYLTESSVVLKSNSSSSPSSSFVTQSCALADDVLAKRELYSKCKGRLNRRRWERILRGSITIGNPYVSVKSQGPSAKVGFRTKPSPKVQFRSRY